MPTVGTITTFATTVAGKAVHAATHPVRTVSTVAGRAREVATALTGGGGTATTDRPSQDTDTHRPRAVRPEPPAESQAPPEPEVRTPAGTTAAAPGHNPSTGETDLEQPGTEPLLDPSLTKAVKSESETMRKAADPHPEG